MAEPSFQNDQTIRIAGTVLKWIRGDKALNFERFESAARQAAAGGAELVCSTECFLDGYAIKDKTIPKDQYYAMGERIPSGEYYQKLADLAQELGVYLAVGIHEVDGPIQYNTAVLIDRQGRFVGKYHKHKLGHEDVRHTPGTECPAFTTPRGTVGLLICADRSRPDLYQGLCDHGADFILCLSGGGFGPKNDRHMQDRSKAYGKHIVFVHPAQFLVTAPGGTITDNQLLGEPGEKVRDYMSILRNQIGTEADQNGVYYFDLPVTW